MRTTVEISSEQHIALLNLAAKRGIRGFSSLVQEALDEYLAAAESDTLADALSAEGSITDGQADRLEEIIEAAWKTWAPAS